MDEETSTTTGSLPAVLLVVAHVVIDLFLYVVALVFTSQSAHDQIAYAMFVALRFVYLAMVVGSVVLAVRDHSSARRSPVHWAGLGLLGSLAVSIVFFVVLHSLGTATGA